MFARISTLFVFFFLGLALMVSSTPTPSSESLIARDGQCNTGTLQCCNSVQSSSDPVTSLLLGLLGVVLGGIDIPIGIQCTPITVIGVGSGANCVQQPVCCTGNTFNGLVTVGCSPINLGL
ncbi:hydrophobin-like protein [Heterobasidion irregulare TC 32-1]|uniref:Hydrophobin n=1 Tax=Heterobasidion irregulare (strain TC 32-1) TaxID=747525 RepID=W4K3E9_HETIT|nr:hydrophobin-like protein [Heterobasidion irregulare TC 32-1]ETW80327.1 hydrophobin-like protein [Heterobasidion irregulare TC 32-1]